MKYFQGYCQEYENDTHTHTHTCILSNIKTGEDKKILKL